MKLWLPADGPFEELPKFCSDAEAMGYEGVLLGEHIVISVGDRTAHPTGYEIAADASFLDPFCAFSSMAGVTKSLRFLTTVLVAPLRNVFALAKQVASLAVLSQNRFVFGVGSGWLKEEFDTVGLDWSTRGRRLDEMLDIMLDFWDDGYAEYQGEFYNFPRSGMFPVPTKAIPIVIGGDSKAAIRRAGRFDGYLPMLVSDSHWREAFSAIDVYRAEHGLTGPYERMIGNPEPTLRRLCQLSEEYGITGVSVRPWLPWGRPPVPVAYHVKRDAMMRFADDVMYKL